MFLWAPIPTGEPSQAFALRLLREAHVAVSPGSGFGADGEGFVRFALVENEQRIAQAVRGIRRTLNATSRGASDRTEAVIEADR
jgi:alanine-synthesizing transaminase